jgi:hypothetical protein
MHLISTAKLPWRQPLGIVTGVYLFTFVAAGAAAEHAGNPNILTRASLEERSGYRVTDAGPLHSRFTRVMSVTNNGVVTIGTKSFTRLSAGQNVWNGHSWTAANPDLLATNNTIIGRGAQHPAKFSQNINTLGATQIKINGTQNQWLKSHVLGIAFESPQTNLIVAVLKDSTAEMPERDPCTVLYRDVFSGAAVNCDLEYNYSASGVSQSVIICRSNQIVRHEMSS